MPAVCFTTKDFTRAHSFLTALAKSRGPYSNSTTKLKVKTMNRTNQKTRAEAPCNRVAASNRAINGTATGTALLFARADATIYPEISSEAQQPMVNAVV